MNTVFLAIHVLLAIALIGIVLLQRSEGGGLGIGGGGGGMSGFMSGRSSANLLTRVTAALAALFFTTSLVLAILATTPSRSPSMFDNAAEEPAPAPQAPAAAPAAPAPEPAAPAPESGAAPQAPAVPQGQ
jgi:preprotein translocase subunit SecG